MTAVIRRLTFSRGFSLVEMAVVLVIVALLIAGMMIPLSAQQEIRARQETEKILSDIREALLGFAITNGRLPRPSNLTAGAPDGMERATCANDADCHGFIPWATLGVSKLDGWGKLIRYSVTPAYANAAITLTSVANRTVQTRDGAGTAVDLASQVPAIFFSHGKERWGTTDAGTPLPDGSATNADEDVNNDGPTNYFSRLPVSDTAAPGGEFDDIVTWLPATVLVNRLIAAGKLP